MEMSASCLPADRSGRLRSLICSFHRICPERRRLATIRQTGNSLSLLRRAVHARGNGMGIDRRLTDTSDCDPRLKVQTWQTTNRSRRNSME